MSKTSFEKAEAFDRMVAGRLPKAVKAVTLLANLARKSDYAWTGPKLQTIVDELDDAVDTVLEAFGIEDDPVDVPEVPENFAGVACETEAERAPITRGVPIEGVDRRDIRAALRTMQSGETGRGIQQLQNIVCGWVVPDNIEGERE